MPDRETVIKVVEYLNWYFTQDDGTADKNDVKAWEVLLQEQEPVQFKVTRKDKSYPFWDSVCTGCGYTTSTVKNYWKYCPVCGKPVKWDADGA